MLPARPGQNILHFLTTDWYNETLKKQAQQPAPPKTPPQPHHEWVDGVLIDAPPTEVGWLEPVVIVDSAITPGTDPTDPAKNTTVVSFQKPASGVTIEDDNWGIVQDIAISGVVTKVCTVGVTWAKFTRTNAAHKYVALDDTTYTLKSQETKSRAKIISFTATSGDDGYGLILLTGAGGGIEDKVFLTPAGGIDAASSSTVPSTPGSAICTVCDVSGAQVVSAAETDTVYNITTSEIPEDTLIVATKIQDKWIALYSSSASFSYFQLDAGQTLDGTFGGTATAKKGWTGTGDPITVTNSGFWTSGQAKGLAVYTDGAWQIIWIQQPATRVLVKIAVSPHDTPGAPRFGADPRDPDDKAYFETTTPPPEILSQFPNNLLYGLSTGECSNAYLLTGEAGDFGILEWRQDSQGYVLVQIIEQRPQQLLAVLTADRPNGLSQPVSCTLDSPIGPGYIGGTITALDTFNNAINAKSALPAHRVLLQWDRLNQQYIVIEAQHQCTHFRGTIAASWSTLQATFNVTPVAGFDGPIPSGTQTVQNIYGWTTGTLGNEIKVEWDPINGYWIPEQMECT